ncbi:MULTISPECIES: YwqI/YxiC family protein [Rossellomorea]|uniref:YwqI/YxiC family protein n=1 Tax=Rossellomorea TaxID=2837508 RepID=UPI001CCFCD61|nr:MULTISPECIES: YwqI/YxiC family protein [Rossellomorea]MCA0151372.1 YwqI/YxiC family protein [Rossellomorea vietnamensis]WGG45644.1 YwqI/YxiC family protein [Rossellomorea sp. DA94]
MSNEIRVVQGEIEHHLSKMKSSAESLQPDVPQNIGQENRLEVVTKLNELNQSLELMLQSYKELLIRNEELTRQAVQDMSDADKELSSHIKAR